MSIKRSHRDRILFRRRSKSDARVFNSLARHAMVERWIRESGECAVSVSDSQGDVSNAGMEPREGFSTDSKNAQA
jgi:hypothetical protein